MYYLGMDSMTLHFDGFLSSAMVSICCKDEASSTRGEDCIYLRVKGQVFRM